ncbi:MAG: PAS domain S-box protein [Candidatus Thermoplasmatota archaeon]
MARDPKVPFNPRRRAEWAAAWIFLAVVYFLAARLGLSITFVNASASPVWPPTGVAIAAILLLGPRAWPGILVGAYSANALTTGWGWPSLAIATGNTLEALAGGLLVQRFAAGTSFLGSPRGVATFTVLAAFAATLVSATVGVTTLVLSGNAPAAAASSIWLTWWLGDATGAILVVPAIISCLPAWRIDRNRAAEALLGGAILAALSGVVFSPLLLDSPFLLLILPIPMLLWAGVRLGPRGAAFGALMLAAVAVIGTLRRYGPLVLASPNDELLLLQAYLASASLTALGVAAFLRTRHPNRTEPGKEPGQVEEHLRRQAIQASRIVAILVLGLGLASLMGWVAGIDWLVFAVPGSLPMKANTALGLAAIGIAMLTAASARLRMVALFASGLATALGALTLVEYGASVDLSIDQLLAADSTATSGIAGRMSPITALALVLLGLATAFQPRGARLRRASDILVASAAVLALLGVTAYIFQATLVADATQIAIHTAVALLLAAAAVPLLEPSRGLGAALTSPDVDGRLARLLPIGIVGIPLALGVVRFGLRREGLLSSDQGILLTVFGSIVLVALVSAITVAQARIALQQRRTAQEAVTRSEEHFRGLLAAAPDATVVVDSAGRIVLANPQAEQLFGYARADLVGMNVDLLVPEGLRPGHAANRAHFEGEPHLRPMGAGLRLSARRQDGRLVPVEISLSPLVGPEGTQVIAAIRDVTAQREAQDTLRKTLASVTEAERVTGRGSWEWDVTTDRAVWSEGMYRLFGLDPKTFQNSNENFLALVHPEDRERMGMAITAALAKPGRFLQEYGLTRPDGQVIQVRGEGNVVVDPDGKARSIYGIVQDVTDLRRLEAGRRSAQERFKRVFDASPVAIALTREDGTFVDVNPALCQMLGYTHEELTSNSKVRAADLYEDPKDRTRVLAALHEAGLVRELELGLRHKDGEVRAVLISLELVDVGGDTTILSLFQDITERKRLQHERETRVANEVELERLRRTDQFRTEFINSMAHELSTPLTPLLLSLSTLQNTVHDEAARRHMETMHRAAERLRHVVGSMVSAADLQARAIALDRQRLNLTRQLKAAVAGHLDAAHRANLTLEDPAETQLSVLADEHRLQLVLGHLLGNAIKFTPAGGTIRVTARRTGEHARIEVTDTGIGLTARQAEGLWKPYVQVHDKTQRTDSGAGLGLYVVKGIVDLHKGEVGCSSPGLGKGSTFWFSLPLAPGS